MHFSFDQGSSFFPALAVLGASLLGSAHCVAMCGGLALSAARSRAALVSYHLGRLLAYTSLGALAGMVGARAFPSKVGGWISVALLTFAFLWAGWRRLRGRGQFSLIPDFIRRKIELGIVKALPNAPGEVSAALALGLLSSLLPCGWLHTFVLASAATRSPLSGALLCVVFWAGTVPFLTLGAVTFKKTLTHFGRRYPWAPAILLWIAAVGTLSMKARPLFSKTTADTPMCHSPRYK